jgi:hypothetical protein
VNPLRDYTIHPMAEKFPAMPPADFEKLKKSIRQFGLFDPIVVNEDDQILEGRHRYKALVELGKDPIRHYIPSSDVKWKNKDLTEEQFIYDSNVHRRHLTDDQKAMLAAEFAHSSRRKPRSGKQRPSLLAELRTGSRSPSQVLRWT